MRKRATRPGSDAGHKYDFLVLKAERDLASEPGGLPLSGGPQTGGAPDENPGWIGGHYGRGSDARGLRHRGVKRIARKGLRRAAHAQEGRLLAVGGADLERYHSR